VAARVCVVCSETLPSWARVDKSTCGSACRSKLCRTRKDARNAFATPLALTTPRSDGRANDVPVPSQTGPLAAPREATPASPFPAVAESGTGPGPRPTNPVILALVVALRDVEQRRARGNVLTDPTAKEQTP
jgi:predicted nucleic acid-binding Zn ribbon protein